MTEYSPMAALNRTYAVSKVHGKEAAITEAKKLEQLTDSHFYFALLGELYTGVDNQEAVRNLQTAFDMAKTTSDKTTSKKKIDKLMV
jgi:RNA polymerase sigma-70 factor (ECF subfamily)